MRFAGLLAFAAVILAVIVTVAPKATIFVHEASADAYTVDFFGVAQAPSDQTAEMR